MFTIIDNELESWITYLADLRESPFFHEEYGSEIFDQLIAFTIRWGALMERKILLGERIAKFFEETKEEAKIETEDDIFIIPSVLIELATDLLCQFWIFGHELESYVVLQKIENPLLLY